MKKSEIAEVLQQRYQIETVRDIIELHGGVINCNFRIDTNDGQFLFRVYQISSPEEVAFEVSVLKHLSAYDYPVQRPILTSRGDSHVMHNGKPIVLLSFIPGQILTEVTPKIMHRLGVLMSELHLNLASFPSSVNRKQWEPKDIKQYIHEGHSIVRSRPMPDAERMMDYITQEFSTINFAFDLPVGLTHQDVKPSNIVVNEAGSLHIIDFDAMYHSVLLYDLCTPIIWMCFPNEKFDISLLQAFIEGYQSKREFTEDEKTHFFGALRFRLLREAFVWPYRWLDAEKAVFYGKMFIEAYRNLLKQEAEIQKIVWKN